MTDYLYVPMINGQLTNIVVKNMKYMFDSLGVVLIFDNEAFIKGCFVIRCTPWTKHIGKLIRTVH